MKEFVIKQQSWILWTSICCCWCILTVTVRIVEGLVEDSVPCIVLIPFVLPVQMLRCVDECCYFEIAEGVSNAAYLPTQSEKMKPWRKVKYKYIGNGVQVLIFQCGIHFHLLFTHEHAAHPSLIFVHTDINMNEGSHWPVNGKLE